MMGALIVLAVTLAFLLPAPASADIIRVPADQPTIQAGIDAAVNGDTVLVADGTYTGEGNKNLDFEGKAITVTSDNGPENCIIDCENSMRGVFFHRFELEDTVLEGITIRNGNVFSPGGGGIRCEYSSPTIRHCIITGNRTGDQYGGGIAVENASPTITNNMITDNEAHSRGGGIYCGLGWPIITFNTISGNESLYSDGGGIYAGYQSAAYIGGNAISDNEGNEGGGISCDGTDVVIADNVISGNRAGNGGGICCWGPSPLIIGNLISGNQANDGGGFLSYGGSPKIYHCVFTDNLATEAYGAGGGVVGWDSSPVIGNCLFSGNIAQLGGAMSFYQDSHPVIFNTTITGNLAAAVGGAVHTQNYDQATFRNCIIWDNTPDEIWAYSGSTLPLVSYSDVKGGYSGEGNIDADPLMVDGPLGQGYLSQIAAGEAADSPCLDAGGNLAEDVCFSTVDGETCLDQLTTRTDQAPDQGQVDMGYHHAVEEMPVQALLVVGPGPGYGNEPLVRVFPAEQGAVHLHEFSAYGSTHYGVNVACGDLTGEAGDGIITGAGPGEMYGPHVRGFSPDGTPLPGLSILAYGTHKWGVNVAVGDLDGDGIDEIITGSGPGAVFGPHVRGWDYDGGPAVLPLPEVSFFAYGTLKFGVNVAAGDLDGDSFDEIVTGAGPGAMFGPHVRGWDVDGGTAAPLPGVSFLAYGTPRWGVRVAAGDVDGDGIDELLTAPGPSLSFASHIRGWNVDGGSAVPLEGCSFFSWSAVLPRFGAHVASGTDLDGDGRHEIVVGAGPDPSVGAMVRVFEYDGSVVSLRFSLQVFPSGYTHGVNVAAGRIPVN